MGPAACLRRRMEKSKDHQVLKDYFAGLKDLDGAYLRQPKPQQDAGRLMWLINRNAADRRLWDEHPRAARARDYGLELLRFAYREADGNVEQYVARNLERASLGVLDLLDAIQHTDLPAEGGPQKG